MAASPRPSTGSAPRRPLLLLAAALLGACAPGPTAAPRTAPSPAVARAPADPLAAGLDSIFADPAFARARWGVLVRSLDTGRTLYRRDAEHLFVPASNQKIVTGAVALEALGPGYRFRTAVEAGGPIEQGVLRGDLVVRGSGDPSISAEFGGVQAVFRAWADSLRAHGIHRIAGRLVGDDDALDDVSLGPGWAWDDLDDSYAAEVGALQLNEGYVLVRIGPGPRAGTPAAVSLDPATAYVPVDNRAATAPAGSAASLRVRRQPTGPGIVVTGSIPAGAPPEAIEVPVRNNTLYFVHVLAETLREAGIAVEGDAVDGDGLLGPTPPTVPLFVHRSPGLDSILPAFLKPSQNQIGELLLKTLGRELRGEGSTAAGVAAVDSATQSWGIPAGALRPADGSGLSRYNLAAPAAIMAILERMLTGPHAAIFLGALPVAGRDGTIAGRMRGTPLEGNVRAKTGTLTSVRALSGHLTTARGERILFSTLSNHHTRSSRDVDRVVEAALLYLYHAR